MNKPKILIVMEGGIIHQITADAEVEITVIDHDHDGCESDRLRTIPGAVGRYAEVYFTRPPVDFNPIIGHLIESIEKSPVGS